ncbi:MAG: hypothetical protein HY420_01955 [Candidatus Kerfeldbacteria bacterium]|nr:hypothetical protein [Candidatus Kerfeldbacteria bacterium]
MSTLQKTFYLIGILAFIAGGISISVIAMASYNDDYRKADLAAIQKETYITGLYGQYTRDLASCREVASQNKVENGDTKCKEAVNKSRISALLTSWGYESLLEK